MEVTECLSARVVQMADDSMAETRLMAEAASALDSGCHVFLPRLSLSADAERTLKSHALGAGRLVLGPGAGVAVLPSGAFGIRSRTARGPVAVFGTSADAIHEVCSLVWDHYETGVSCALDVGCRDLTPGVGGLMTEKTAELLAADSETLCLCLVAHEPVPEIRAHLHEVLTRTGKPSVVRYLGTSAHESEMRDGILYAAGLDEAAQASALLAAGKPLEFRKQCAKCEVCFKAVKLREGKALPKRLAAFFSAGDLALETAAFLRAGGMRITMPVVPESPGLLHAMPGHLVVDVGVGTDWPPDPAADVERKSAMLRTAAADASVGALMFDVILGDGVHADPAPVLLEAVRQGLAERQSGDIVVMASITGTKDDPQDFVRSKALLKAGGVVVVPTAAKGARIVSELF